MTVVFGYPGLSVGASDPSAPRFVTHPPIRSIEWACPHCGKGGPGFPPEEHSSGACEATRRTPRLVPEVARDAQYTVVAILHGATHFMDGGGI